MAIQHKDIAAIREDYTLSNLAEQEVSPDPLRQFLQWFEEALHSKVTEPNAMVLSTINELGFPSSRVVLLKDIKQDGLSFFSNYESQKAKDIGNHNAVSLLFFWPELQRQVRIMGKAEKLNSVDSDEYFASRPRGSQIGAWSSPQSRTIPNREFLETEVEKTTTRFGENASISRPDFWGGYLVRPTYFEFWQGRASRLHDRIAYQQENEIWTITRLAP